MKYISFIILLSTYLLSVEYGTARNETLFNQLSQKANKSNINLIQEIERDIYTQLKKISSSQKRISNINSLESKIFKLDRSKLDKTKILKLEKMQEDLNARELKLKDSIAKSQEAIKMLETLKRKLILKKGN